MNAFVDLELQWLKDNGATANTRADAWKQYLSIKGFDYSTYTDARYDYLKSLGYTGTTQDMLIEFWALCGANAELAVNGTFDTSVIGYEARGLSTIAWDPAGAMLIDVLGVGGGFLSNPIPETVPYNTYRLSIDLKGITYFGGFKFRLGEVESILTESITSEYVTYTADVEINFLNQAFEMFRNAGVTGTLLVDNISIKRTTF